MYTRYYDGYPTGIQQSNAPESEKAPVQEEQFTEEVPTAKIASISSNRFGKLNSEDILLIALLMITVTESKDDFLLPLILGALLLE